jgi:hypothetical protein
MAKLVRLNQLPEAEKNRVYALLIPPALFSRFQLDPETGTNRKGEECIRIDAPVGGAEAAINLVSGPEDQDPVFYVEVSETRDLVQLSWDFIMVNDPDAPRFYTDLTPEGGSRWLNWRTRNRTEELMALSSGLAPGQIRLGMGLTGEFNGCLDRFCEATGFKSVCLEALFYHNALLYERHGFRYFEGEPTMRWLDREFQPGGSLYELMDGSPFRKRHYAELIRGRSWAIHDGIMDDRDHPDYDAWQPPKMYRMVGSKFKVDTAPGVHY